MKDKKDDKPKGIFDYDRDDRALARAINELTEWLKTNHAAVTKRDLEAAEQRIIKAIKAAGTGGELSQQDQAILNDLSARAEAQARKLEALAALTPNE